MSHEIGCGIVAFPDLSGLFATSLAVRYLLSRRKHGTKKAEPEWIRLRF